MKTCLRCGGEGPFSRDRSRKDGLQAYCRPCVARYNREYAAANTLKNTRRAVDWQRENRERQRETRERYRQENKEKWTRYASDRRARKRNSMPVWVNKNDLQFVYDMAKLFGVEVDHIEPLAGKRACGLHVPWNLQLLTKEENRAKHITTPWPQSPRSIGNTPLDVAALSGERPPY